MQPSHTGAWILTALLAVYGAGFIATNYATAIVWYARHKHGSLVPLMGGVAVGVAMLVCPITGVKPWAWIPLVVDLGCAYLFGGWLYHHLFKKRHDDRIG